MNIEQLKSLQARIRNSVGPYRELDYDIADALGTRSASDYTASLDACVALQEAVLPGYFREVVGRPTRAEVAMFHPSIYEVARSVHRLETHAHLLAIFAAVIEREEAIRCPVCKGECEVITNDGHDAMACGACGGTGRAREETKETEGL